MEEALYIYFSPLIVFYFLNFLVPTEVTRSFGEDITNKQVDDQPSIPKEDLASSSSSLKVAESSQSVKPMKPRAPEKSSQNGNRPIGNSNGRSRSFRQSKGKAGDSNENESGSMLISEAIDSSASPVTPQKHRSPSAAVTPSAADFESPQPFAHKAPLTNPFETPMLSFVQSTSVEAPLVAPQEDGGLYAEGDDFAKLLEVITKTL